MCKNIATNCFFCAKTIGAQAEFSVSSKSTFGFVDMALCKECHSFNMLDRFGVNSKSEHQAQFHEFLFEVDRLERGDLLNEVSGITRIITTDYPEYFGDKKSDLICECGSGRGTLLKALLEQGYRAFGCEYSAKLVEVSRTHLGLACDELFQLDAWDLPAYLVERNIKPTTLILWHVIEHIENSLKLIESLVNSCSNELTIIIQTPLPVPEYVFPEHLFFPSTETFHYLGERLNLPVKLLYVIPYTRYITCVLSNKKVSSGLIYPRESDKEGFNVVGQFIAQLNAGLNELDLVTKEQYSVISHLKHLNHTPKPQLCITNLSNDIDLIRDLLEKRLSQSQGLINILEHKLQEAMSNSRRIRLELTRAEAENEIMRYFLKQHNML